MSSETASGNVRPQSGRYQGMVGLTLMLGLLFGQAFPAHAANSAWPAHLGTEC